jgi:hypothetical protein
LDDTVTNLPSPDSHALLGFFHFPFGVFFCSKAYESLGLTCQGAELPQLLQLHTSQEKAETNSPKNFTIKTFVKLNSKMGDLNPPQHADLKRMTAEFLSKKQIFFRKERMHLAKTNSSTTAQF